MNQAVVSKFYDNDWAEKLCKLSASENKIKNRE